MEKKNELSLTKMFFYRHFCKDLKKYIYMIFT